MQVLFDGLKKGKVSPQLFQNFKDFDPHKAKLNIAEFLRFFIQLCTDELSYAFQIQDIQDESINTLAKS